MNSSNDKVNQFLKDIQLTRPDDFEIVEDIRAIFINENEIIDEDVKYGGIVFNVSGQLVAGIFVYKKHISIEFSNGATFSDPQNLLEGKGKLRRHLKLSEKSDVTNKDIVFYIKQAVKTKES